ncbi:MAG TPA: hypothetical protein DHU63_05305, partial [Candidatus Marinimicrobia bacterium]|nr:hypothetical protein [Candidatus Neomarinimicrobiota bacterium]
MSRLIKLQISILLFGFTLSQAQISSIIPAERMVNWEKAGLHHAPPPIEKIVQISTAQELLDSLAAKDPAVMTLFQLDSGEFIFNSQINLPSRTILRGLGSRKTEVKYMGSDTINTLIWVKPPNDLLSSTSILNVSELVKGSRSLTVDDPLNFNPGDVILFDFPSDSFHVHGGGISAQVYGCSEWRFLGQINRIESIFGSTLTLTDPCNFDYSGLSGGLVKKLITGKAVSDVGIENLSIGGNVANANFHIWFKWAFNCWVRGVESNRPRQSHFNVDYCTHVEISGCYLHHAGTYIFGGYGIRMVFMDTDVLVEDNIFEHLRHAMSLSQGINGNVFGYNYSREQYSEDRAGTRDWLSDLNLHGHFPYANLLEGNVIEYIGIDTYWGYSGPDNTFFRNRSVRRAYSPNTDHEGIFEDWKKFMNVDGDSVQLAYEYGQNIVGNRFDYNQSMASAFRADHNSPEVNFMALNLDFDENGNCDTVGFDAGDPIGNSCYHASQPGFMSGWPFEPDNYQALPAYQRWVIGDSAKFTVNRHRYVQLANQALNTNLNLGGTMGFSLPEENWQFDQFPSGSLVQMPDRDMIADAHTINENLSGLKHLNWDEFPQHYLLIWNEISIQREKNSLVANYDYPHSIPIQANSG